jgi:antitoxin ParD1/3/4
MNVSLMPEMEQYVQNKVGSGLYTSASEVVREALRLIHLKETRSSRRVASLRDALQQGLDDVDRGEFTEWNHALLSEIKETERKRRNA